MSKKPDDHFDQISDLFDKITSDQTFQHVTKSIVDTVDTVSKEINKGFSESLKSKGYDNFGEYIRAEVSDKKRSKPTESVHQRMRKHFNTRYDYFIDALSNITYDLKYRGLYREGHEEAINSYIELAKSYTKNLSGMQVRIAQDIKEMQLAISREKRNRWNEGYLNGVQFVNRSLHNSKIYMMNKMKREIEIN